MLEITKDMAKKIALERSKKCCPKNFMKKLTDDIKEAADLGNYRMNYWINLYYYLYVKDCLMNYGFSVKRLDRSEYPKDHVFNGEVLVEINWE